MMRVLALVAALFAAPAMASVTVVDDAGRTVTLPTPAHRIVSLAPNITDALFAAGAGHYVVGTTRYSDHPAEAKDIPIIGDATMLDLERIVALKPDVIVVWRSGTPAAQVEKLMRLGIPVFYTETTRLEDIGRTTRQLGKVAGTEEVATHNARAFDVQLAALRATYANKPKLKVFYQIWDRPLMTIGRSQIIDDAITLCGGSNIFSDLSQAAPTVTREAVLARDPDVIISGADATESLEAWRTAKFLTSTKHGNVINVDAPTITLPSPSILPSVAILCRSLEEARERMKTT